MTILRPYRSEDREEERITELAYVRGVGPEPYAAEYPAHLHIDLLPEAPGQGAGRRLIQTLFTELRRRGVPGLHLGMDPANTSAAAFYERLGMQRLPGADGSLVYGIRLAALVPTRIRSTG
ncbi:GNAT family N-acetyltransferase [Microbacterium tenebrionis]|uniref:GNAT family N-acetyltransferase n=1 Tax=Microbacterium tenebrionis TaxID=2830665 RepID=UPI00158CDF0A